MSRQATDRRHPGRTAQPHRRLRGEAGVTAIEYGLLAALLAVGVLASVSATGTSLEELYTTWTRAVMQVLPSRR